MRLTYEKIGLDIKIVENQTNVLQIENPKIFIDIVQEFFDNYKKEGFCIFEDGEELDKHKVVDFIYNPFDLRINDKKILSKLYSEISILAKEMLVREYQEFNSNLLEFVDKVIYCSEYDLEYVSEIEISEVLKLCNVKIKDKDNSFIERIIEYIRIISKLQYKTIFVFVNLKQFLMKEEIEELYKFSYYEKVSIILLENKQYDRIENENLYILDKDLCWIKA